MSDSKEPLTPEEVLALQQAGIFKGDPVDGKQKVSASLLSPPEHVAISSLSNSSPAVSSASAAAPSASLSLKGIATPAPEKTFKLPTDLESVSALQHMGFTQTKAEEIYQAWSSRPSNYPYDFLRHVNGYVENRDQGDLSDREFMTELGLDEDFQDGILDPEFAGICGTETVEFWILDTLHSRYHSLGSLLRRARDTASRAREKDQGKK